jgi:signal transduction histidine kinase
MTATTASNEVTAINGVITDRGTVDFHTLGLAGCIDRLTTPLRLQGIAVHWETPHHGIEISARSASLLYQAAKEALTNTYRHAAARDVTIRLAAVFHGIRLTVTDTGSGFDSTTANVRRDRGFGLRLMSIAVHEAGGNLHVESSPGAGTSVTVTLPLD